jgi:hypothetical protein
VVPSGDPVKLNGTSVRDRELRPAIVQWLRSVMKYRA